MEVEVDMEVVAAEKRPAVCFPVPINDRSSSDCRGDAIAGWLYFVLCFALEKKNRTVFKCRSCNVPVCIDPG